MAIFGTAVNPDTLGCHVGAACLPTLYAEGAIHSSRGKDGKGLLQIWAKVGCNNSVWFSEIQTYPNTRIQGHHMFLRVCTTHPTKISFTTFFLFFGRKSSSRPLGRVFQFGKPGCPFLVDLVDEFKRLPFKKQ